MQPLTNNFNIKQVFSDPRKRTIVITVAAAVVLLIALVVVIVNATKKPSTQHAKEDASTAIESPVDIAEVKEENVKPVENKDKSGSTTVESNPAPVEELPTTGPESILPLIAIILATSAFVTSRNFATRKA